MKRWQQKLKGLMIQSEHFEHHLRILYLLQKQKDRPGWTLPAPLVLEQKIMQMPLPPKEQRLQRLQQIQLLVRRR